MFGKKKQAPEPIFDVTKKVAKTWWGGTKLIPTTKSEQRKMKAEILLRNPNATVLDSRDKKQKDLEWIDRIEGVNPKFCVNSISGANRAKLICGGSRLVRLPPCKRSTIPRLSYLPKL